MRMAKLGAKGASWMMLTMAKINSIPTASQVQPERILFKLMPIQALESCFIPIPANYFARE